MPASSAWLFPEYDFTRMNPDQHAGVIMERILNRGPWAEIRGLFDTYGKREIAKWVRAHGYLHLDKHAFNYRRDRLGIKRYTVPPWDHSKSAFRAWKRKQRWLTK